MAYDLEEQEQLEAIKEWWGKHGNLILLAVVACAVTIAAFYGWRYYKHQQGLAASTFYEQLKRAERANDAKKTGDIATQIIDKYPSTPYAAMAALSAARLSFDTGDLAAAKSRLQWLVDHGPDEEARAVARLRLAAVLLDEKNYAEALKQVDTKPGEAYSGLYADMKGDILMAQGKPAEARSAYQLALDKSDAKSPYHQLVQLKLDALGGAK